MESHGTPRSPNGCYAPTSKAFMYVYRIPILNLFWKKTLWKHHPKTPHQTDNPPPWASRTVLAHAIAFHDFTLAVLAQLILSGPGAFFGRFFLGKISPTEKKGPIITWLDKRNFFLGSLPNLRKIFSATNIETQQKPSWGFGHHPLTAKMILKKKRAPTEFSMVKQPKKHPFLPKIP